MVKRFFTDKDGQWAIIDWPNLPLVAWIFFALLAKFAHVRTTKTILSDLADIALLIWAGLEIVSGKSWFRRVLGVVVTLGTIINWLR